MTYHEPHLLPPQGSHPDRSLHLGAGGREDDGSDLVNAVEQLFWAEVRSPASTVRSLAVCYALLIAYAAGRLKIGGPVDAEFWRPINTAIEERFGWVLPGDVRKIDRLRKMAWGINAAACDVMAERAA